MRIASDMTALVGNTPMVYLNGTAGESYGRIAAKLECYNPLFSIKDRIAVNMLEDGISKGLIGRNTVIVEPTSGNTGIGLSFAAAAKGLKTLIFMPESFSPERRAIMKAFGAELNLTPAAEGMKGAIDRAEAYCRENGNTFMPMQFENPANPDAHRKGTGPEIWRDTDGKIDIFVSGVGTGGTITGCGEYLKSMNSAIKIVAVEPDSSPVLSGGEKGTHRIQGIGAGFVPKILNREIIDEVIRITDDEAVNMVKTLAEKDGIFAGISAGAAAAAAVKISMRPESKGRLIVAIFPDSAERYLSSGIF